MASCAGRSTVARLSAAAGRLPDLQRGHGLARRRARARCARRARPPARAAATLARASALVAPAGPVTPRRASTCATSRPAAAQPSASSSSLARQQLEVVRHASCRSRCPGPTTMRSRVDAARAQRRRRARAGTPRTCGDDVAVACGSRCIVAGSPCMCIRQTPQRGCAATTSSAPGCAQRPDVVDDVGAEVERLAHDLGLVACRPRPARRARRAARSTGSTRAQLVVERRPARRPGRLDSPPMSRMSAPSLEQLLAVRERRAACCA